jgi:hypothetical protein
MKMSSNRREFDNIVIALEEYYSKTGIHDVELFMFTYNMVSENAFYIGTSSSPILFELVLWLRLLKMHGGWKLHVIHIAGKCMIQKGTDGLSQGDMMSGIMGGVDMLSFVPLGKGADERSGSLKRWLRTWWKSDSPAKWLTPERWFDILARQGWFVWCPPPAIADAVLEHMYKAQQKRPQTSAHLFICPRIMTSRWRNKLFKAATFSFTIPITSFIWGPDLYEPLIVYVCLQLSKHRHWDLQTSKLVGDVERSLRGMQSFSETWAGNILREICEQTRRVETLSSSMVRQVLRTDEMGQVPGEGIED